MCALLSSMYVRLSFDVCVPDLIEQPRAVTLECAMDHNSALTLRH
jgi:hypothetical protein